MPPPLLLLVAVVLVLLLVAVVLLLLLLGALAVLLELLDRAVQGENSQAGCWPPETSVLLLTCKHSSAVRPVRVQPPLLGQGQTSPRPYPDQGPRSLHSALSRSRWSGLSRAIPVLRISECTLCSWIIVLVPGTRETRTYEEPERNC